jgi:hypothetical protein
VIAADPAHWDIATTSLIRAVAFDGLTTDHPAVRTLLGALAPVAEAEFACRAAADAWFSRDPSDREGPEPQFPELAGPVFLLGTCVLVDATWAIVGEDPLTKILSLRRCVHDTRGNPGADPGRLVLDQFVWAHDAPAPPGCADRASQAESPSVDHSVSRPLPGNAGPRGGRHSQKAMRGSQLLSDTEMSAETTRQCQ